MKQLLLFGLSLFISTSSFSAKKKPRKHHANQSKKSISARPKIGSKEIALLRLCDGADPQPTWFLSLPIKLNFPATFQVPSSYRVLKIDEGKMDEYLKSIPSINSKTKIILPLFRDNILECKEFIVERTQTMDSVLQAKYPGLMSFRAYTSNNQLNAARIDCDGGKTNIMITYDKKVYFVTPIVQNKQIYYICYAKDDPNLVKKPFEGR